MTFAAQLTASLVLDVSQFTTRLQTAQNQLTNFGTQFNAGMTGATRNVARQFEPIDQAIYRVTDRMMNFGAALTIAAVPVAAYFKTAIQQAGDFEAKMAEIEVRAGATAEEMLVVQERIMELATQTVYGPQQISEAFLQLMTSGLTLQQSLDAIAAVLMTTSANGTDLGETSDRITDVMQQFGITGPDAARRVGQAMTGAASVSSASFDQIADAFSRVGTVARSQFDLTVEETASVLAILANMGIKGPEAGTNFKSMMMNMLRDTERTSGAWDELGIELTDANGNMRELDTIMLELNRKLQTMPEGLRNKYMRDIFGSYGVLAANSMMLTGSIEDTMKALLSSVSIEDAAIARTNTFEGAIAYLSSSMEAFNIGVFMPLLDGTLTPFVRQMGDAVNAIGEFLKKNPELAGFLVTFGAIFIVVGPIITVLAGLVKVITMVVMSFWTFGRLLFALIQGIFSGLAFIIPIIAKVLWAVWGVFIKISLFLLQGIFNLIGGLAGGLVKIVSVAWGVISPLVSNLAVGLVKVLVGVGSALSSAATGILTFVKNIASGIGFIFNGGLVAALGPALSAMLIMVAAMGAIYLAYQSNFLGMKDSFDAITGGFVQATRVWDSLGYDASQKWASFWQGMSYETESSFIAIEAAMAGVVYLLGIFGAGVIAKSIGVSTAITFAMGQVASVLLGLSLGAALIFAAWESNLWGFRDAVTYMQDQFYILTDYLGSTEVAFGDFIAAVGDAVLKEFPWLRDILLAISTAYLAIWDFITRLTQPLRDFIGGVIDDLRELLELLGVAQAVENVDGDRGNLGSGIGVGGPPVGIGGAGGSGNGGNLINVAMNITQLPNESGMEFSRRVIRGLNNIGVV